MTETAPHRVDFAAVTAAVVERLRENRRVRRTLPGGGRVKIDRQLPFLCVYRTPPDRDDAGARRLVTTEAAYLVAPGDDLYRDEVTTLCDAISGAAQEHFDAFLLIEIWTSTDTEQDASADPQKPVFRVLTSEGAGIPSTVSALEGALREISINGRHAEVTTAVTRSPVAPPGRASLVSSDSPAGCVVVGLEVRPIFRDDATRTIFPIILQRLRSRLAVALRQSIFAFTDRGSDPSAHYEALGPTALTRSARQADRELGDISFAFDFLRQVTPINSEHAWKEFQEGGFRRQPHFWYRPLPYHPNLLKRRLFEVPIEHIEDATLGHLCAEKQNELDLQLTALRELDSPAFRYSSLQIHGLADADLVATAEAILQTRQRDGDVTEPCATADDVVEAAEREIDHYRQRMPAFNASVVREDVAAGLQVSRGQLYVSDRIRLRRSRLQPLMHHEVGTHLLTYFNGAQQPFGLLQFGLAGYEALQEGLAVLAEHIAGGLTRSRLRTLAARVVAVQWMLDRVDFVECFRRLLELGFPEKSSFTTTLRAFRGGGLTKDVIYLRGLQQLLRYLAAGHDLEPLYVGKFGLQHVPYVRELRRRGVLRPPAVLPRLWDEPRFHDRLSACRGMTLLDLMEHAQ